MQKTTWERPPPEGKEGKGKDEVPDQDVAHLLTRAHSGTVDSKGSGHLPEGTAETDTQKTKVSKLSRTACVVNYSWLFF